MSRTMFASPRLLRRAAVLACVLACTSCASHRPTAPAVAAAAPTGPVTISVIGTNDLHGAIVPRNGRGGLALFASYVAALRTARAHDGAVLLLDAGDMFQGTLPSNLTEGQVVVEAYGEIGYDAAAIGNHEFDYGPVGERVTPRDPGDNPFGALQARAREARFPFLAANLLDAETRRPIAWANVRPSVLLEKAGVKVGVIGVTTEATLRATMAANVETLAIAPIVSTVIDQAAALRAQGAQVIVVAAHAGGRCTDFTDPSDIGSCDASQEIMGVASALPAGTVHVIVAGHTHAGMAQVVNGIAIVEAFSTGRAFSRVDLTVDRGRLATTTIHPPVAITAGRTFEGAAIVADSHVAAVLEPAIERARAAEREPLGVTLADAIRRAHNVESAEGNLFADLMLAARPAARIAITNGGGLRADLPPGPLTYGALYEAMPFDNRFALVTLTGAELAAMLARNLERSDGILSIAGTTVEARCDGGSLVVNIPFEPDERVIVATSDFLATGPDLARLPADRVTIENGPTLRDEMAAVLIKRGGHLRTADVFDPDRPRIKYPGQRPVRCVGDTIGDGDAGTIQSRLRLGSASMLRRPRLARTTVLALPRFAERTS